MQNVLISGGAGFIGSHLCKKFLDEGLKVLCVDNLITGSRNNIVPFSDNPNFSFINHDITDPDINVSGKLDAILHFASPASPNKNSKRSYINHPIETLLVNSYGTYNLLELAKKNKSRFIYASSSEVYGDPDISLLKEDYFGNVNPNGIRSVYDEGKRFGEAITMAYFRKYKLDARIIRIFNTYGDMMQKDDGRVVSNFVNQAINNQPITIYGTGKQTRSFCYVDDLVEGIWLVLKKDGISGEVMNLGNPDEYTIIDFANIIIKLTGSRSRLEFKDLPEDDPLKRKPDIGKAKKLLGYDPKITLVEGLKKTIDYFSGLTA